ncbi:MAG: acetate/propionate family kinase [Janthinobacterium lividum]
MTAQTQTILVLNSGSSSLKFALYRPGEQDEDLVLKGSADGIGHSSGSLRLVSSDGQVLLHQDHLLESREDAFAKAVEAMRAYLPQPPVAVGHRMVHGGPHLREHQLLTPDVEAQLQAAVHFAPLHIPPALALLGLARAAFPSTPQFACFDTAFHRTMPPVAARLPIPQLYFDQGVQRYGFHGLSYESLVHRLGDALPEKVVFAHLGNGASVTAVLRGQSIDTSMGLTPTGGIPMGTRSGDLDPGVLLFLQRSGSLDVDALESLVNQQCGLAGLSGGESDMQALLSRAKAGDADAELAVNAFCTAVCKQIGSYAALLGGLDLLVFTGGIGEHSAEVRRRVCASLGFLGIHADDPASTNLKVLPAEEEIQIARHCRRMFHETA